MYFSKLEALSLKNVSHFLKKKSPLNQRALSPSSMVKEGNFEDFPKVSHPRWLRDAHGSHV